MAAARRRNQGPQPSMSPFILLGGLAAAVGAVAYGYPGAAAVWLSLLVAAWMEPPAILTGKKDSSGYPAAAHPGEEKALARYKFWRDMKFRTVLPNGDWLPGWPVLGSWLGAVVTGAICWFVPVKLTDFRWVDALAGFVAVAQVAGSRRRTAGDGTCPGTRLDALAKVNRLRLVACAAAGLAVGGLLAAAALLAATKIPANYERFSVVTPQSLAVLVVFGCVLLSVAPAWMTEALADWRELVAVRQSWAPRWMALKKDPAPYLTAHKMVGEATVDTFEAPASEGAMAYWLAAPKISPTIGAGMRVAVLECLDEGPQGPIPGSRHPLRFDMVSWPSQAMPSLTDPAVPQDVAELLIRCAMSWTLGAAGFNLPVLLESARITVEGEQPAPTETPRRREKPTPDENAARVAAAMHGEPHQRDTEPEPQPEPAPAPQGGSPTSAWASRWAWPTGPLLKDVRPLAPNIAATAECEVLVDHKADAVYFGSLTDASTEFVDSGGPVGYATLMANLTTEDKWSAIWKEVMKQGTNPPTVQHATAAEKALQDGTVITRLAFVTRLGVDPGEFRGLEGKLATALQGAPYCAITGWPGGGKRPGERHPMAFTVYWSAKPVPGGPDSLAPSPASAWVLAGKINTAFDGARLARPEIASSLCLTRARSMGHIWKIDLRLYGGVTLADVRGAAARLRTSLGVPWLRVAEWEDGCSVYVGAEPGRVRLAEPERDTLRLIGLDWEQAWNDTKVRGSNGLLPALMAVDEMPMNRDVKVLTFALPPGLELLTLREASKKLSTATGNEYVEVRKSERGPKFARVLCCETNPMPGLVEYDFEAPVVPGQITFATGIDGAGIAWRRADGPHLLYAGTSGSGKAQVLDARLPVPVSDRFPTGWATVSEITIGDTVLAADGTEQRVYGLSPIAEQEVYEVVLSDGQVIECGPDHLWWVSSAAGRHAWAPREVTVRDANTAAALARADAIRATAATLDSGTAATREQIATLAGVSLATVCRLGAALEHLAVPLFVETSKPTTAFEMGVVLDYMLRIADTRGACRLFGLGFDRQVIDRLRLRGQWLSVRDFACALLGREATRDEVTSAKVFVRRSGAPGRADGTARMLKRGYPAAELLRLVADRVEGYISGNGRATLPLMSVVSTREMFTHQRTTDARAESNYAVPLAAPYDPPGADLSLDPYVLGAWLGDGDSAGGRIASATAATCTDDDGLTDQAHLIEQIAIVGMRAYRVPHAPERTLRVEGLTRALRPLGLLHAKHIPAAYLRGSFKQRLSLLQGLMDTDGSIDESGACELTLCDETLAAGALELIRSLGIRASMRTADAAITRGGMRTITGTRWRIGFTSTEAVFRLPRKAARIKAEVRPTQQWNYVGEVRRTGRTAPMRCLMVDSAEHTYLTGGFVPTHNSAGAQNLLYGALIDGCEVVVIDPTKGAADFAFLKPYAKRIVGLDSEKDLAEHLIDAAATMKAIYAEGLRRRKLNSSYGVGSYLELPEAVRPRPLIVFIDEFTGLIGTEKVQRTPFDDPEMEFDRQMLLATNMAKQQAGMLAQKIAAEARAWGIHLILGTQKLSASMLDSLPGGGANLKVNLARILLGKTTPGDRMSALRVPEDYPEMGENIGKGRGVWEPLDDTAMMIQVWFATQARYTAALEQRVDPVTADRLLDTTKFRIPLPEKDPGPEAFLLGQVDDGLADGDDAEPQVVEVGTLEFTLDDLDASLIEDDPAAAGTADEDDDAAAEDAGAVPDNVGELDWAATGLRTDPPVPAAATDELDWAATGLTPATATPAPSAAVMLTDAVVFIDVDGTLSPIGAPPPEWDDWAAHEGSWNGTVHASPAMLRALAGLGARLVWLTDWGHDANTTFGPLLGIGDLDVAQHPGDGDYWWKIDAVLAYLDAHPEIRRVAWADDKIGEEDEVGIEFGALLADLLDERDIEHLLLDCAPVDCLTREQLDELRCWLGVPDHPPALGSGNDGYGNVVDGPVAAVGDSDVPAEPVAVGAVVGSVDEFAPYVRTPVIRPDLLDEEDPFR